MHGLMLSLFLLLAPALGYADGPERLAKAKGCFSCHDLATPKVGPAFKQVSAKYAGRDHLPLVESLKRGSRDHWGPMPMPPQSVTDREAEDLVRWILSLK